MLDWNIGNGSSKAERNGLMWETRGSAIGEKENTRSGSKTNRDKH